MNFAWSTGIRMRVWFRPNKKLIKKKQATSPDVVYYFRLKFATGESQLCIYSTHGNAMHASGMMTEHYRYEGCY